MGVKSAVELSQRLARKLFRSPSPKSKSRLDVLNLEDRLQPTGTVTGQVFLDYNANGTFDSSTTIPNRSNGTVGIAGDTGFKGVTVSAYDQSNTKVGSAVTDGTGNYSFSMTGTGPYRIEFTGLPAGVLYGPTGTTARSNVQFVPEGGSNGVNLAVTRTESTAQYATTASGPQLVTQVYQFGASNGANAGGRTLWDWNYNAGTEDNDTVRDNYRVPDTNTLSITHSQIGATWGLSYDTIRDRIFAAAFTKRFSGYGPNGPGAVYVTNGVSGTSTASLYTDLNALFPADLPAGADFRGSGVTDSFFIQGDALANNVGWNAVGKTGLGGMDITDDGSRLFVIALGDRRLYSIPTTGAVNAGTVQRFNLPIPASVTGVTAGNPLGDLRPFAVEVFRGKVYIGATNTAESTQSRNDLKSYVFCFNPATGQFENLAGNPTTTEAVHTIDLNYQRGIAHPGDDGIDNNGTGDDVSANWLPWTSTYSNLTSIPANATNASGFRGIYPQAWLTSISFEDNGNMTLAFRDRAGDQFGRFAPSNPANPNELTFGIIAGDMLKAFGQPSTGWTTESNGSGGSGVANGQGPGGGEFYGHDNLPQQNTQPRVDPSDHDEVAMGAALNLAGYPDTVYTSFDPERIQFAYNSGGVRWASNANGSNVKGYQIYKTEDQFSNVSPPPTFAKANGLGDLIAIAKAPVSVGNFVWFDADGDGVQDPNNEPALGGITVQLWDAVNGTFGDGDDKQLAQATTDASGNYYFSSGNGTTTTSAIYNVGMIPGTNYQIRIPLGQAPLNNRKLTQSFADTGNDKILRDSNGVAGTGSLATFALINFTAPQSAGSDDTLDIGFTRGPTYKLGDFVWEDANNDGVFQTGENPLSNITVQLLDSTGTIVGSTNTGANGDYLFSDLDPGKYTVRVVASSLPAGYISSTGKVGFTGGPYEPAPGGVTGNNTDHGTSDGAGFVVAPQVQLINADILTQDFGFFRPLSLGDFVWLDTDNSGTVNGSEAGIDALTVQLLDGNGGLITSATTAGGGKYLFTNLVPGKYQVRVQTPAGFVSSTGKNGSPTGPYEPGNPADVENQDHGTQVGGFAVGPVVTLTAPGTNVSNGGNSNLTQDFGLIQPLSLGDTVWLDSNNNGKFDAAESLNGIGGVTVNLRDSGGALLGTTTTNPSGGYLFTYLLPGTYRVEIVNSTLPAGLVSSTGKNGSATGDYEPSPGNLGDGQDAGTTNGTVTQGALVTLAVGTAPTGEAATPGGTVDPATDANSNRIQDFGFFRPLALGNLVWDDVNNSGKFDAGDIGLDGVAVTLLDGSNNVVATTTTAGGGAYLFDNLTAGDYRVRITPPAGYASSTGQQGSPTGPYEPGVTGTQDNEDHGTNAGAFVEGSIVNLANAANLVDLGGRANLRQDFGLFRSYSIGDTVWLDVNNNGKLDSGENGIQDVVIDLLDGTGVVIGNTKTNGSGNYSFGGLAAGKYQIRVTTPTGLTSSTGKTASLTGPYEPGVTGLQDNEDHGTTAGIYTVGGFVNLGVVAEMPDSTNSANLRQDFGFFAPISLGDTVWVDGDNSGKLDGSEAGRDGVTVDLLDSKGTVLATTTTASGGKYLFSNLHGATYQVRVTPPAGFISSSGTNGSLTGAYEPSTAGINANNEDHGSTTGAFIFGPQVDLTVAANRPDSNGTANLSQDFGIYQPLSIGNLVWGDTNNDGKLSTGETGLANVPVELFLGTTSIGTTTTDASGKYGFGNLVPGDYRVVITPPAGYLSSSGTNGSLTGAYEPGVTGTQDNEDHGTTAGSKVQTALVTLGTPGSTTNPDENGTANLRQDFGLFQPLSLGNFVFYDKNNDGVFEGADTALSGVTVQLLQGTTVVGTTTTDANGKYLFTNLVPGTYDVAVTPVNALTSSSGTAGSNTGPFEPVGVTGPDNSDHGTTVGTLIRANGVVLGNPGDTTANPNDNGFSNLTIDFGLIDQPANAKISGFVYVDPNINGIRETTERPIPGTKVTLTGTDKLGNTINQVTFTDTTGFYQFVQLPPGTYTVTETQPTGILFDGLDTQGSTGGTVTNDKISSITLNANDNSVNNNFGEIPPAQVFGFVYEDLNRNNRFDPGEPPIPNTTIRIDGTAFAGSVLSRPLTAADSKNGILVTTDSNGRWEFFGLPPGNYTIRETQPAGYADLNESNEDKTSNPVTIGNDIFSGALAPSGIPRGAFNFGEIREDRRDPTKREFLGSTDPSAPGAGGGQNLPVSTTPNFGTTSGTAQDPTFVINAAGPGRSPLVRVFDYTAGIIRNEFLAYETSFTGGVRVAQGDINGDGIQDIVTSTGIGGGPRVRVFSGADNSIILQDFFAYESSFRGGVFVAVGDINGDGRDDIITGTESGGGPRVRVFDGTNPSNVIRDFFAFDPNQRGGVRVASGDVTGDGRDDLVASTGTGQGVPTRVRTFDGVTGNVVTEFAPFGANFTGGANVAVGRFSGTVDSIVVSADSGGGPVVGIYNGTTGASQAATFAYDSNGRFGVRVATADINGDGISDIITSPSGGTPSHIKVLNGASLSQQLDAWFAFDTTFLGGTFVA